MNRLLQFVQNINPLCPTAFGYVWSRIWAEEADYLSGPAGRLLSHQAFWLLASEFDSNNCKFHRPNDVTMSKCMWRQGVQLIHDRAFYYDAPEKSRDR